MAVGSRSSVEAVEAGGELGHLVAGVVGSGVVPEAEHDRGHVGASAVGPALLVMQVGAAGWLVAALGLAAAGFDHLGDALGVVVEAAFAADVEDLGSSAEDGGDDPGFAGHSAGQAG